MPVISRFHLKRFDQHDTRKATPNTLGRDTTREAVALNGIDQVQHDPITARAHCVAKADSATVDIKPFAVDAPERCLTAEGQAVKIRIIERRKTSQHLGRKSLVQLPKIDILQLQFPTFE